MDTDEDGTAQNQPLDPTALEGDTGMRLIRTPVRQREPVVQHRIRTSTYNREYLNSGHELPPCLSLLKNQVFVCGGVEASSDEQLAIWQCFGHLVTSAAACKWFKAKAVVKGKEKSRCVINVDSLRKLLDDLQDDPTHQLAGQAELADCLINRAMGKFPKGFVRGAFMWLTNPGGAHEMHSDGMAPKNRGRHHSRVCLCLVGAQTVTYRIGSTYNAISFPVSAAAGPDGMGGHSATQTGAGVLPIHEDKGGELKLFAEHGVKCNQEIPVVVLVVDVNTNTGCLGQQQSAAAGSLPHQLTLHSLETIPRVPQLQPQSIQGLDAVDMSGIEIPTNWAAAVRRLCIAGKAQGAALAFRTTALRLSATCEVHQKLLKIPACKHEQPRLTLTQALRKEHAVHAAREFLDAALAFRTTALRLSATCEVHQKLLKIPACKHEQPRLTLTQALRKEHAVHAAREFLDAARFRDAALASRTAAGDQQSDHELRRRVEATEHAVHALREILDAARFRDAALASRTAAGDQQSDHELRRRVEATEHAVHALREILDAARFQGAAIASRTAAGDQQSDHDLRRRVEATEHAVHAAREFLDAARFRDAALASRTAAGDQQSDHELRRRVEATEHAVHAAREILDAARFRDAALASRTAAGDQQSDHELRRRVEATEHAARALREFLDAARFRDAALASRTAAGDQQSDHELRRRVQATGDELCTARPADSSRHSIAEHSLTRKIG